ncbi:MAG TPA: DNA recombination protein RmuC [Egibacteraceae bacterium]
MDVQTLALVVLALAAGTAVGVLVARRGRAAAGEAAAALDSRADVRLLDQRLGAVQTELARMTGLVRSLERDRAEQLGLLSGQLRATGEQTRHLAETTRQLREALASSRARGQWGERMADDVLRLAGFVEHVNYVRQRAIPGRGTVPDYTFLLPRGRVVHMDVKFPLDNYLRCVNADSAEEAERHRRAFLRDVRDRIRELGERGYDDGDDAVDCVLLFIPNEQLAAFIQEHDPGLLDEALRAKVVCCSPLTLFAVLAVIRQAVDAFALQRRSADILAHLSAFTREWERFVTQMDRVETHLDRARRAFDDLLTTRRRSLERPLERLADLRRDPAAGADGGGPGSAAAEDGLGSADTGDGLGGVRPAAGEPPSGGLAAEAGGAADSASRDPAVSADAGRAPP